MSPEKATYDVVEDLSVDGGEGAGSGAHLGGVVLGVGRDNGSVGDDDNFLFELLLKLLNHEVTDLLVASERSVGDLDEEVLSGGTVGSLVLDVLDAVDEDYAEAGLEGLVVGLEGGESLGHVFLEVGGLGAVLLNDFISSTEHAERPLFIIILKIHSI